MKWLTEQKIATSHNISPETRRKAILAGIKKWSLLSRFPSPSFFDYTDCPLCSLYVTVLSARTESKNATHDGFPECKNCPLQHQQGESCNAYQSAWKIALDVYMGLEYRIECSNVIKKDLIKLLIKDRKRRKHVNIT